MTDGSNAPPVPPATVPPPSASRLRRERPGPMRGKPWVWWLAGAGFVGILVTLYGKKPEHVTQGEALALASAVENARDAADLLRLCDIRLPMPDPAAGDWSTAIAEVIARHKEKCSYTRILSEYDAQGRRILLFRVHRRRVLVDYHVLRLERRDDGPRITGFHSQVLGGWYDEILAKLDKQPEAAHAARLCRDLAPLAYPAVPVAVRPDFRAALPFSALHLGWLAEHDRDAFPAAAARFQQDHPGNATPDLLRTTRWLSLKMKPEEAIVAIDRLEAVHFDPDFFKQLREDVWK